MTVAVTMLDQLLTVVLAALFAVGFRALLLSTPLRKLNYKPFSCDTCLVGWGSILGLTLADPVNWTWQGWAHSALVLFQIIAATGLARLLVIQLDRRGLLPDFDLDSDLGTGPKQGTDPVIEISEDTDESGHA